MVDEIVSVRYEYGTGGTHRDVAGRCVDVTDDFVVLAGHQDRKERQAIAIARIIEVTWTETKRHV